MAKNKFIRPLSIKGAQVLGERQSAIASMTITATSGTLPTANGALTIANAATPTVAELQEGIVELLAKQNAILAALRAHGLIAT
jgi:hypothetical protein